MAEAEIVRHPQILGGKPTIKGTRLSVELILGLMAAGHSVADVVSYYPGLTDAQVRECLRYASEKISTTAELTAAE